MPTHERKHRLGTKPQALSQCRALEWVLGGGIVTGVSGHAPIALAQTDRVAGTDSDPCCLHVDLE
jgi:hypothetical protein